MATAFSWDSFGVRSGHEDMEDWQEGAQITLHLFTREVRPESAEELEQSWRAEETASAIPIVFTVLAEPDTYDNVTGDTRDSNALAVLLTHPVFGDVFLVGYSETDPGLAEHAYNNVFFDPPKTTPPAKA